MHECSWVFASEIEIVACRRGAGCDGPGHPRPSARHWI